MSAESNLAVLLRTMAASLGPDVFVFVTVPSGEPVPGGVAPVMMFREAEGLTLIVPKEQADATGQASAFPSRMITLNVQSALDAVGFLAAVTAHLAKGGIAVNPVSGFHHDHLFVPEARADDAMAILKAMAAT